jgi:hypothetical protein
LEQTYGTRARCDPGGTICAKEERLRLLAVKLKTRGLDARLTARGVPEDARTTTRSRSPKVVAGRVAVLPNTY